MASKVVSRAIEFFRILRLLQEEESRDSCTYEEDIQILKMTGDRLAAVNKCCGNQTIFVCQKVIPKISEPENQQITEISTCAEDDDDDDDANDEDPDNGAVDVADILEMEVRPQPLAVMKARQLLSLYTLSQNPGVSAVETSPALHPLWVRCDMSDPAGTTWFGAEPICLDNKVTGVKLYSVTCKGSTVDKKSLMTLEELTQEHQRRHHPSTMEIKGSARFNLFGSTVVENTIIESQSSVTVDFKWNHVGKILETPPLQSSATLNIKVACGDMRSPMFEMYRELEFLQTLADGLRTGETEWMEPLESTSAVNLIKAWLEDHQNTAKTLQDDSPKAAKSTKMKPETDTPILNSFLERGDLDFVEQLWVRMTKSVTSHQDIGDCLKIVTETLKCSDYKPWIHRDSSSSLSKLILQSYQQEMDCVSFTGVTPVNMLLEIGLEKKRKDYTNYLIGEELTTMNHLSYYLSTKVDLQEQTIRLRKLHHLLEIIVTCSTFLGLPYDTLFLLTQSCLQHYKTSPYDEEHEFKIQIKPALISHFYQKEHPELWGVEVSSGNGPHEVWTLLQFSDRPLVDHAVFETDYPNKTVNGDSEEPSFFSTLVCSSLVSFSSV